MEMRRWLDEIVRDARYAFRTIRKTPGFTINGRAHARLGIGAFGITVDNILRVTEFACRSVRRWSGLPSEARRRRAKDGESRWNRTGSLRA